MLKGDCMARTEEGLLTLLLSVEHLKNTAIEQQKAVADTAGGRKGNTAGVSGYF